MSEPFIKGVLLLENFSRDLGEYKKMNMLTRHLCTQNITSSHHCAIITTDIKTALSLQTCLVSHFNNRHV